MESACLPHLRFCPIGSALASGGGTTHFSEFGNEFVSNLVLSFLLSVLVPFTALDVFVKSRHRSANSARILRESATLISIPSRSFDQRAPKIKKMLRRNTQYLVSCKLRFDCKV